MKQFVHKLPHIQAAKYSLANSKKYFWKFLFFEYTIYSFSKVVLINYDY